MRLQTHSKHEGHGLAAILSVRSKTLGIGLDSSELMRAQFKQKSSLRTENLIKWSPYLVEMPRDPRTVP